MNAVDLIRSALSNRCFGVKISAPKQVGVRQPVAKVFGSAVMALVSVDCL